MLEDGSEGEDVISSGWEGSGGEEETSEGDEDLRGKKRRV